MGKGGGLNGNSSADQSIFGSLFLLPLVLEAGCGVGGEANQLLPPLPLWEDLLEEGRDFGRSYVEEPAEDGSFWWFVLSEGGGFFRRSFLGVFFELTGVGEAVFELLDRRGIREGIAADGFFLERERSLKKRRKVSVCKRTGSRTGNGVRWGGRFSSGCNDGGE